MKLGALPWRNSDKAVTSQVGAVWVTELRRVRAEGVLLAPGKLLV